VRETGIGQGEPDQVTKMVKKTRFGEATTEEREVEAVTSLKPQAAHRPKVAVYGAPSVETATTVNYLLL
jgi:hypothetical protein